MPAELTRPRRFACDYEGCKKSFITKMDLDHHKVNDPEHSYCDECDLGFCDWKSFVRHKVLSDKHLSCPVCGEDFGSKGGLERHVTQSHQRDQRLVCLGCKLIFPRAAALIGHLERSRCKGISKDTFTTHLHRKEIIDKLLADPKRDAPFSGPEQSATSRTPSYASSATGESEQGGVQLMDAMSPGGQVEAETIAALVPTPTIMVGSSARTSTGHSTATAWPSASVPSSIIGSRNYSGACTINDNETQSNASVTSAMTNLTIKSNSTNQAKDQAPDPFPPLTNPVSATSGAWCGPSTFTKLFPDAKATPQPAITKSSFALGLQDLENDFSKRTGRPANIVLGAESILGERALSAAAVAIATARSNLPNVFNAKLWDPSWNPDSENYTAERFFSSIIQRYECPFHHCEYTCDEPIALSDHLQSTAHEVRQRRCPSCLRIFQTPTALMAHCESPSTRCTIRHSSRYGKIVDHYSGGFLEVVRPKVRGGDAWEGSKEAEKDLAKEWRRPEVRYEAVKPDGLT